MTKIKICGLSRIEDILAVNTARPDYIGFVFAKSRRQVDEEKAICLKRALLPGIVSVGVFVDEAPRRIASLYKSGCIEMVQLHGSEDAAYRRHLKGLADLPVIQAVRIGKREDIPACVPDYADEVLLDNGKGGTGRSFNWRWLGERGLGFRYFLAGGVSLENMREAIEQYGPYAIDISSGVETDGAKDPDKISRAVALIRSVGK